MEVANEATAALDAAWKAALMRSAFRQAYEGKDWPPPQVMPLKDALARQVIAIAPTMYQRDAAKTASMDYRIKLEITLRSARELAEAQREVLSLPDAERRLLVMAVSAMVAVNASNLLTKMKTDGAEVSQGDLWYTVGSAMGRVGRLAYEAGMDAAGDCHMREAAAILGHAHDPGTSARPPDVGCRATVYPDMDSPELKERLDELEGTKTGELVQKWAVQAAMLGRDQARLAMELEMNGAAEG